MKMTLTNLGIVCALGNSEQEIAEKIKKGNYSDIDNSWGIPGKCVPFGSVNTDKNNKPSIMRCYELADMAIAQISNDINDLTKLYDISRLGIVIGASNTGIHEAQKHIDTWIKNKECPKEFSFEQIELGSPALYIRQKIGWCGPAYTVSTACSSSAKAFRSARDLIINDICDAVLVGGIDARCDFALNGFNALETISSKRMQPMSKNRNGINLGEGAAIFIMEKDKTGIYLTGIGENSDAYHSTQPDPEGKGAIGTMLMALNDAGLSPCDIDYINLHGTGTSANDAMESIAVNRVFGDKIICASTKPLTGHTLGAAGGIEAGLSYIMLKYGIIIPHIYDGKFDNTLPKLNMATGKERIHIQRIISNSFAFGGSNACIILEN